jgi:hypothetical protein
MADVFEYLIDGTSGLAPGGVDGSAMVVGVCSKGEVGKGYLLGKRSDLAGLLGVGPLVDRLRDIFVTGGQNPIVIAVPVTGQPGGYISPVRQVGVGAVMQVSGVPQSNANVVIEVVTTGTVGVATVKVSTDGGATFSAAQASAMQITLAGTGATATLPEAGSLTAGTVYSFSVRTAVGPVAKVGTGPELTLAGTPTQDAQLVIEIVRGGSRNSGTYRLSLDGGDTFGTVRTIPVDGLVAAGESGVTITFAASEYEGGTTYSAELLAPAPSITDVMTGLELPLELYDVEFIHVAGPTDSIDWAAAQAKAEELWNAHRPTFFKMETRLPQAGEDLSDWVAALLTERASFTGRFVQVCAQFGEVAETTGESKLRNWGGLQAGRALSIPVQRATGRVRDGAITQGTLPEGWGEGVQKALENAGYLTAKVYAGLRGAYWGDSKTMAEVTSDYQYEEVLRVTFKAVRKLRIAALKSMYDELGDPLVVANAAGLAYLSANLETALKTMTTAVPKELAAFQVEIPTGQDYVNNGVAVETTLIGIPIIRKIKLFANYAYAGSSFDPRLTSASSAS